MKKLLLLLALLLASCSADPIETTIEDQTLVDNKKYYNLQWETDCNTKKYLWVNDVRSEINSNMNEDVFMYNVGFNPGDRVRLEISSTFCNSNVWTHKVAIWEWNNPEQNGQHIVYSKSCNTCTTLISNEFIIQ